MIGPPQPQTGPGEIRGAAGAFEGAVVGAAEAMSHHRGDPRVSAAFALGWQMGEPYRPNLRRIRAGAGTKQSAS